MLFMVIERFRDNDMVPIYKRVCDEGRKLRDGLEYIDSWVEPNFSRCFQLMKCDAEPVPGGRPRPRRPLRCPRWARSR